MLALALAVLALAAPASTSAQAAKAGWWIRVDTKKTEADAIGLQVGTSAKERRDWRRWRAKEPAEFDLTADLAQAPELHLRAVAIPDDEDVWFCVYYKGRGVRHFDFDTQLEAALKQSDHDDQCR